MLRTKLGMMSIGTMGMTLLLGTLSGCIPGGDLTGLAADDQNDDLNAAAIRAAAEAAVAEAAAEEEADAEEEDPAPEPAAIEEPVVLLDQTLSAFEFVIPRGFFQAFSPESVGKLVTVQVAGESTGSRIVLQVFDPLGNIVINEDNPLTNITTGQFVTTTTADHFILAFEQGRPSSTYRVVVISE